MKLGLPLFVVTLLLLVCPPARAGGSVRAEGQRVSVSLSAPPITRVRVSFDQESGRHLEVSFDPAKSDGLIRNLYLGSTKADKWNVSVSADPIVLASGSTTHFLSLLFKTTNGTATPYDPATAVELTGTFSDAFAEKLQPLQTYVIKVAPPASAAAGTPLRVTSTPAPPVAGARSADISGIADELVRIVAEIAVDRARSRGLGLLASQIKDAVCTKLVWTPEIARALQRPTDTWGALLPRTCRALEGLRLEELAASVKVIEPELVGDLSSLALGAVEGALTSTALRTVGRNLADMVQNVLRSPACPYFIKTELTTLAIELRSEQPSFVKVDAALRELMFLALDASALVKALRDGSASADFASARIPMKRVAEILDRHPQLVPSSNPQASKRFAAVLAVLADPKQSEADVWAAVKKASEDWAGDLPLTTRQKIIAEFGKLDAGGSSALGLFHTVAKAQADAFSALPSDKLLAVMWEVSATRAEDRPLVLLERGPDLLTALSQSSAAADWKNLAAEVRPISVMIRAIARILPDLIAGRPLDETVAQKLVLDLQDAKLTEGVCSGTDSKACAWACGVDAAMMVIASCQQSDTRTCTASEIKNQLAGLTGNPPEGTPVTDANGGCVGFLSNWPELAETIAAGAEALRPRPDASRKEVVTKALAFGFDVLERRACATVSESCSYVRDMRVLMQGIVDEDATRILLSGSALITRGLDKVGEKARTDAQRVALKKTLAVAGALTTYASTYTTADGKTETQNAEQLHDARKKAIEGLIDATTQRSDRGGEFVASLGVNPGFVLSGYQRLPKAGTENQYMPPQLSLPIGLAFQWLPNTKDNEKWKIGHHIQFAAADLGQFIAIAQDGTVSEARWDSFLMAGLQYGVIIGTPSNNFMIGVDARWSPTVFTKSGDATDGGGALRAGLFASYYVPFFDLN